MTSRSSDPEFIEAIARGLDVMRCFGPEYRTMSLSEVATAAQLPRPTARRVLRTLQELGYVAHSRAGFELTPRVLELGMSYIGGLGLWDMAAPHMRALVAQTGESSSISQLDGSDIVYVARVAVPKIIALQVSIGTRFPASVTSQGKVLLAALSPAQARAALATPSRSGVRTREPIDIDAIAASLIEVRAQGWALADEELAPGVRSIAVPIRDFRGAVHAAMNVTVHAAETSVERLVSAHLPPLLVAAGAISADWVRWQCLPHERLTSPAAPVE